MPGQVAIAQDFEGIFSFTGKNANGDATFAATQRAVEVLAAGPGLKSVVQRWAVNDEGKIYDGEAVFASVNGEILKATFVGTTDPQSGEGIRDVSVTVTFADGTGLFKDSSGGAAVRATLYDDGRSTGSIKGNLTLPGEKSAADPEDSTGRSAT